MQFKGLSNFLNNQDTYGLTTYIKVLVFFFNFSDQMIFQIKTVAEGFSYQRTCVRFLTLQIFKLLCFPFQKVLLISQACSNIGTAAGAKKRTPKHTFFCSPSLQTSLSPLPLLPPSPLALSLPHPLRFVCFSSHNSSVHFSHHQFSLRKAPGEMFPQSC